MTTKKWILQKVSGLGALGLIGLFVILLIGLVDFSTPEWKLYINSKLPQSIVKYALILSGLYFLEWVSPNQTINTIMKIDDDSPPVDKRTACFLLIGWVGALSYALSGGY